MMRSMLTLAILALPAIAQDPTKEEMTEVLRKLESKDPKVREEGKRQLTEIARRQLPRSGFSVGVKVMDQEKMRGAWNEKGGVRGWYELKSLGSGLYQLRATKTGPDGVVTTFDDKGTMQELRRKYTFLRSFAIVSVVPPPNSDGPAGAPDVAVRATDPKQALGITLRRPSKDLEFHLKLPTETTWIVESVKPGSIGAQLDLKKMDLLTHADDVDLSELATLKSAKRALAIVRRGKPMRLALPEKNLAMPEKK